MRFAPPLRRCLGYDVVTFYTLIFNARRPQRSVQVRVIELSKAEEMPVCRCCDKRDARLYQLKSNAGSCDCNNVLQLQ